MNRIGKIVGSRSHIDYLCQVYGPGEIESPPPASAYAFGTFVRIELDAHRWLAGVVYDTQLLNPAFGSLGPRLSPREDLAVFSPDYLNECATLAGVMTIGACLDGQTLHGVPRLHASLDAMVVAMSPEEISEFHHPHHQLRIGYVPLLAAQQSPTAQHLLLTVFDQLHAAFPDARALLTVLRDDLGWRTAITPVGGRA
jgi:hypothetical protein